MFAVCVLSDVSGLAALAPIQFLEDDSDTPSTRFFVNMTRSKTRKLVIAGAGVLFLVVLAVILAARPNTVSGAPPGAAIDVQVVPVEQKDVPIYGEWIGTLDGLVNADVRAQVTGYLQKQGYQEGAFVKRAIAF
jgi:multidrug efflux pump subunit AcrA (membrane-fusion protein)